jgi:hypothetical protein
LTQSCLLVELAVHPLPELPNRYITVPPPSAPIFTRALCRDHVPARQMPIASVG